MELVKVNDVRDALVLSAALKTKLTVCSSAAGDHTGECRAHGNLGSAFFSSGNYREALNNHRLQLVLAMKLKDREVSLSPNSLCSSTSDGASEHH